MSSDIAVGTWLRLVVKPDAGHFDSGRLDWIIVVDRKAAILEERVAALTSSGRIAGFPIGEVKGGETEYTPLP